MPTVLNCRVERAVLALCCRQLRLAPAARLAQLGGVLERRVLRAHRVLEEAREPAPALGLGVESTLAEDMLEVVGSTVDDVAVPPPRSGSASGRPARSCRGKPPRPDRLAPGTHRPPPRSIGHGVRNHVPP